MVNIFFKNSSWYESFKKFDITKKQIIAKIEEDLSKLLGQMEGMKSTIESIKETGNKFKWSGCKLRYYL